MTSRMSIGVAVVLLALTGCAASEAAPIAAPTASEVAEPGAPETISGITCSSSPRPEAGEYESYRHPSESFYAADSTDVPTDGDLEHLVVKDNAIIVKYSRDLPEASIAALADWSGTIVAGVVLPSDSTAAVLAYTQVTVLECDGVDTVRLGQLSDTRGDLEVEDHDDAG